MNSISGYKKVLVLSSVTLVFGCGELWDFVTLRGNSTKYMPDSQDIIFPTDIDVSSDGKIYFAYSSSKGNAICSMDIETSQLIQLTEDNNSDYSPVVSNDGEKVIFKRGSIFGDKSQLYIINSDGTKCIKILDKDIYILNTIFSKNDSTIYFIGGAFYNDTLDVVKNNFRCLDIFSVDIDGNNFRRITYNCVSSWVEDLKYISKNTLLISVETEVNYNGKTPDFDENCNYFESQNMQLQRKPYKENFVALLNIQTGEIEKMNIQVTDIPRKEPFKKRERKYEKPTPLLRKSAYNYKDDNFLFGNYHFYIFDYKNKTINYSFTNDSILIYNYKFLHNKNKIIGGIDIESKFKLILFDIEENKIERELEIDTNKFTPSPNKTIFIKTLN
ncbi:MAG: hypothetical protein CMD31_09105 [Flavobacteriales bacterium]|nr:hypothetical protein [Flavobacteriales bacterium]MBQ20899.1 hypothetical protein [Flavobacteriales bacterium]|tara:strand:- start:29442 stop:30602 length:1161 start_codon:yes stop_codon:yes gene_type:complete